MADDGGSLFGWILGLGAVVALAGAASGAGASSTTASTTSSTTSRTTSSAATTTGASGTGTAANAMTVVATGTRSAPVCEGLRTVMSSDRKQYQQYLVSTGGSGSCSLVQGDEGSVVAVLQRALNACEGQTLTTDGIYGPRTAAAVETTTGSRAYAPSSSHRVLWPWRYTATGGLTGVCSSAGSRVR